MSDPIISRKAAKSLRLFRNNESGSHVSEEETKKHHHSSNNNSKEEETCSSAIFLPHENGLLPEELKLGSLETSVFDCNEDHCETSNILEDLDSTEIEDEVQANVTPRDESRELIIEEDFDCVINNQQQQQQQQQQQLVEEYPLAVELQPFHNKVGGHTAIFKFSHRAVCKELVNRENQWYETIEIKHPELLNFMPKYIGVLNVRYNDPTGKTKIEANAETIQDDMPEVSLVDNPHMIPSLFNSNSHSSSLMNAPNNDIHNNEKHVIDAHNSNNNNNNNNSSSINNNKCQIKNNFHGKISDDNDDNNDNNIDNKSNNSINNNKDNIGSTKVNIKLKELVFSEMFSPKAIKRHRRSSLGQEPLQSSYVRRHRYSTNSAPSNRLDILSSLEASNEETIVEEVCIDEEEEECRIERFLLLEDLTHGMKHPSVLDLKMGTRQYGIEASIKKRISQRKKCSDTTSRLLGTRICGMQVWDKPSKKFINRDKYFGRRLKVGESFVKSICRFLYDGESIYSILRHIRPLIDSCDELLKRISNLINYRLYGSSILLMYDDRSEIIVRLIDFAQCVIGDVDTNQKLNVTFPPVNSGHCDDGYLRGLKSLKFYFTLIFEQLTDGGSIDFTNINDEKFKINCPWLDSYESNDDYICPYNFNSVPTYDSDEIVSD